MLLHQQGHSWINLTVLSDVSFSIFPGDGGIDGAIGAGKTSLLAH